MLGAYEDRDEAVAQRLRSKLRQPSQLIERRVRLGWLTEQIAEALGEAVLLDSGSLGDAGLSANTLVTVDWPNASYENALKWMLDPFDLTYLIDRGALVITTQDECSQRLFPRFHSGLGVVYEYDGPAASNQFRDAMGGSPPGGSGGGFGGGGGFFVPPGPNVISVVPVGDPPRPAPASQAGLSQGGEANQPPPARSPRGDGPGETEEFPMNLSLAISQTQEVHPQSVIDSQTIIDQITSLVAPNTWDEVGGPGSLGFFPPTMDFVISTTDEVHQEIAQLLEKLRKLPPAFSAKSGLRPARAPKVGPDDLNAVHGNELVELVRTTVAPNTWGEVGGPGSMNLDVPRLALVVSTTSDVHSQLHSLLAQLRRSRYAVLRPDRPWITSHSRPDLPRLWPQSESGWSRTSRLSELPPRDEELSLLSARRVPQRFGSMWRRAPAGGQETTIHVRRQQPRLEWETGDLVVRCQEDQAVLAYAGLRLAERGPWAEPARRWLDAALPWLPHRSNEELSRLFDVSPLAGPSPAGQSGTSLRDVTHLAERGATLAAGQTRLQLTIPGYDASQCRIEAAWDEATGRLLTWDVYRADRLTARLRLEYADDDSVPELPTLVTAEDDRGQALVRWQRLEARANPEVPALDEGWQAYLRLDADAAEPAEVALRSALDAFEERQWANAAEKLQAALAQRPQHPLLSFLRAWCGENDPSVMSHEELIQSLQTVAASPAVDLTRLIAQGSFSRLSPAELYEVLLRQKSDLRSADDWESLSRAALAAGQLPPALSHLDRAGEADRFSRARQKTELLLRLKRFDDAPTAAQAWAARPEATIQDLGALVDLFLDYGQGAAAEGVLQTALTSREWPSQLRSDLLRHHAMLQTGLARVRLLLEAAALLPTGGLERAAALEAVTGELAQPQHAELAAHLAAEAPAADVRTALLRRQAELTRRPAEAVQIGWQLHAQGKLPAGRLPWLCSLANQAGQSDRVIRELEALLRQDIRLTDATLFELATAYRLSGRKLDARRASTHLLDNWPVNPPRASPAGARMPGQGGGFF